MKYNFIKTPWTLVLSIILSFLMSCQKEKNKTPLDEENLFEANQILLAVNNLFLYNDSCVIAKSHASNHLHHFDSLFHHHDSLYYQHHGLYHHGDTSQHHMGTHHTTNHHHQHDSIINIHHKSIH